MSRFDYSSIDGHLGCFYVLACEECCCKVCANICSRPCFYVFGDPEVNLLVYPPSNLLSGSMNLLILDISYCYGLNCFPHKIHTLKP